MTHITSTWSWQYCMEDPARHGDPVYAADSSAAHEAEHVLTAIADAAEAAEHPLGRGKRTIAGGWSAEQPSTAAVRLLDAHAEAAHAYAAIATVAARVAGVIETAHHAAREAYAAADAAIYSRDLLHYRPEIFFPPLGDTVTWIVTEAERHRVDSGRQTVIATLNGALAAAYRELNSEARDAARSLDAAPWTTPPTAARSNVGHAAAAQSQANLAALQADLDAPSGPAHELAVAVNRALLHAAAQGQTAQLLVYDPTDPPGQGSVAIAIGDVDAATSVAVVVPGITNSPAKIGGSIPLAGQLNDKVIAKAGAENGTAATVLWWGYDIPLSWPDDPGDFSLKEKLADTLRAAGAFGGAEAGARLAQFITGLRTTMPATASLNLLGFSWGSIVVSQAARLLGKNAGVDNVMELGSPGAGYRVSRAADYTAVDSDHVYVLDLPKDPVALGVTDSVVDLAMPLSPWLRKDAFGTDPGPFGPDPADPAFGARVINVPSVEQSRFPIDFGVHTLANYLDGESLEAVAAVVAGNYADVPLRRPK